MKKLIVIFSVLLFVGAIIIVFWSSFRKSTPPAVSTSTGTNTTVITPPLIPPLSSSSIDAFLKASNFPTSDTITLGTPKGGVVVKNFYKTIVDTEEGFVWIRDNDDYRISYNTADSNFYIDIFSQPFDAARKKAEKDFLDILDVGQSEACKLKVVEFAPAAEVNLAGKNLWLSFCTGRVQ